MHYFPADKGFTNMSHGYGTARYGDVVWNANDTVQQSGTKDIYSDLFPSPFSVFLLALWSYKVSMLTHTYPRKPF